MSIDTCESEKASGVTLHVATPPSSNLTGPLSPWPFRQKQCAPPSQAMRPSVQGDSAPP
eukprot:CAMPEP_0172041656 /NCGR_PEP_ID=MMETSP1041-20130122/25217_1 /TAXON_ID=464988 /ORGANISM="Hemiselmis andersenii, Strain CCMP439" /LENGTH=58 /DNA_ID=CAMNT_0012699773 /DNA_START=179 /DNA_END=355 /DNA_ORIENTATION=-